MKPLKIESIPPVGLEVDDLLEASKILEIDQERGLGFSPSGPLEIRGTLTKEGRELFFRGTIRGRIFLECARCLELFPQAVDIHWASEWRILSHPIRTGGRTTEAILEETESGWIQEGALDLTDRILEEVILTIPIRPLCRESCLGLCPVCGENRNIHPCLCQKAEKEGPFSLLKKLKINGG